MATKETYQSTLTQGILNPRESRADMVVHVTGLDGGRDNLYNAIISAKTGRLVHPDDLTIPLRYATARWIRGADRTNNAEALVFLTYDKRGRSEVTDATEFTNIANINVRYETIIWWSPDIDDTLPYAITGEPDPSAGNSGVLIPTPKYITVPIMDVEVPVVLSSSPISTILDTVGKTNDGALTLSGKSFAANTIRNNGLIQRVTKIDDGASVTYEFAVNYSFSIRRDGWRRGILENNSGAYRANAEDIYARDTFPTFPTS